ncbi:MAG: hypothetical protein R3B72_34865 [Polyangiaceae bacterium]
MNDDLHEEPRPRDEENDAPPTEPRRRQPSGIHSTVGDRLAALRSKERERRQSSHPPLRKAVDGG